MLRLPPQL